MMKKCLSVVLSSAILAALPLTDIFAVYGENSPDYSLWDKFIKYDLCITDYDSLTDEEKELCKFIFETEQSAVRPIRCERARRILAHDERIGERITLGQLDDVYGIWDNYSGKKYGWQNYIHCVPDLKTLDEWEAKNVYWLDDEGEAYVIFTGEDPYEEYTSIIVHDEEHYASSYGYGEIEIAKEPFGEWIDKYLCNPLDYSEAIEYNGDYYYITPENTAVFLRSGQSHPFGEHDIEPVTEPCVIPSEINGYPVTAIEGYAFLKAPYTEIVLPDTLKFIDEYAFASCEYLEKINFPHDLEYIGSNAFGGFQPEELNIDCPNLYISPSAFLGSWNLTDLNVNAKIIDEKAFSYGQKLKNITIGENVEKISANAFFGCEAIENVTLSSSVKAIGQGAFLGDKGHGLKSITIPPTVEVLGALPAQKGSPFTSGIDYPPTYPLTDAPVCVFNEDCVIYGYRGTEAESYANEWGLEFVELDVRNGDVNLDGEINIADVVSMQSYLLGRKTKNIAYMDVNGDGSADIFDMIEMRKMIINN